MEENRRDKFDFVPQDVPELFEKHRWKRGTDSARLLQASVHCLSGLVFVLLAKDFAESSWLSWEPELKFAFVALLVVAGIGWLISAASLGLVSYVNLNIFSQGFVLAGSCAAAAYLAGASGLGPVWAVLIFCGFGCAFFELLFGLWRLRRRDAEQLNRLKRLGQVLGLFMAAMTAAGVALFLYFRP